MTRLPAIGKPISRLEGHLKVTGKAKYAGEYSAPDLLYGYVVNSTITKGKIKIIDTADAKALEGVIEIFTHENRPSTAWFDFQYADMDAPPGTVFKPLKDNEIKYNGQPIALVVATTFEMARYASTQIKLAYTEKEFETNLESNLEKPEHLKKVLHPCLNRLRQNQLGILRKLMSVLLFKVPANSNMEPNIIIRWRCLLRLLFMRAKTN